MVLGAFEVLRLVVLEQGQGLPTVVLEKAGRLPSVVPENVEGLPSTMLAIPEVHLHWRLPQRSLEMLPCVVGLVVHGRLRQGKNSKWSGCRNHGAMRFERCKWRRRSCFPFATGLHRDQ